ncbi:hypothetical protein [Azospirillum doebereinerae]
MFQYWILIPKKIYDMTDIQLISYGRDTVTKRSVMRMRVGAGEGDRVMSG